MQNRIVIPTTELAFKCHKTFIILFRLNTKSDIAIQPRFISSPCLRLPRHPRASNRSVSVSSLSLILLPSLFPFVSVSPSPCPFNSFFPSSSPISFPYLFPTSLLLPLLLHHPFLISSLPLFPLPLPPSIYLHPSPTLPED